MGIGLARAASPAAVLAGGAALATDRPYAERAEIRPGLHDQAAELLLAHVVRPVRARLCDPARALRPVLALAERHEAAMRAADDAALQQAARAMRPRLRTDGFTPELAGECFALVGEAAARTLGRRHYPSQRMAAWGLIQGRLVEMATGEGKTFSAALAAATVALSGHPVHVITVNDYLAARDAEEMAPLYGFLGLSTGAVVQGMGRPERRAIYARPIAYCTNKELAFDYLRDKVATAGRASPVHLAVRTLHDGVRHGPDLVLRGLCFGIVDEADSVFIDEARTPLILSAVSGDAGEAETCREALDLAASLTPGTEYALDQADRSTSLTRAGRDRVAAASRGRDGVWASVRAREEMITQAVTALTLFRRDEHYVVADGKVQIVDESTGRVMPDRAWERGLHQIIEVKEGCALTEERETLARLTYQRLFRRYLRLSGMTGTGREVAREIRAVYGLDVARVPLHRPSRRRYAPDTVCATRAEKWEAVAAVATRLSAEGRPVLIGTRSVGASEEISAVLAARGVAHALLNAKQDAEEADIVAAAGQPGRVTVATNMAGRGTDIRLGPGVAERGGLHVILTEYHESRRIDRQLFGRCARQGDPGSCEAIVSLEDDIYAVYAPHAAALLRRLRRAGAALPASSYRALRRLAQRRAERRSAALRLENLRMDERLDRVLAFSGRAE